MLSHLPAFWQALICCCALGQECWQWLRRTYRRFGSRVLFAQGAVWCLQGHGVLSPPGWLIQELAQRLRQHLGLNLFNFDVIVPLAQRHGGSNGANCSSSGNHGMAGAHHGVCSGGREGNACSGGSAEACQQRQQQEQQQLVYHVIDINYFPGYEKLPGYEDLMVQFLQSIWGGERGEGEGGKAPRLRREEGAQAG